VPRPSITRARPYTPRSGAFAGETFYSERQYRNALARRKGFRSWWAQQRAPRVVRSRSGLRGLTSSQGEARLRALDALSLMRRDGLSLEQAARRAGTTPNTVRRYVGSELDRHGGRYVASPADRLVRVMNVVARDVGQVPVIVHGSRQATLIAEHQIAIGRFLATGDEGVLRPFVGKRVAGLELETDPQTLKSLGEAHRLEFEDIYELAA
jgi:hypothetical protein